MSLLILCLAAFAVVAFATSVVVGGLLAVSAPVMLRLAPAARARLYLAAAFLPVLASLAVMTAALAPSFGWIADHCVPSADVHSHPHICAAHHLIGLPAWPVAALAAVLLVRLGVAAWTAGRGARTIARTRRALVAIATRREGVDVLPFASPQAFAVGLVRPRIFVTEGLLAPEHREHLAPVLAHESAHVRRGDPLRRAAASAALAFHVPGLGKWIGRSLARAQEMAADEEAARDAGPERVARALVALSRASLPLPTGAVPFGSPDVVARVECLLELRRRADVPRGRSLFAVAAASIVVLALSADAVHHGVELALGLLSG